MWCGDGHRAIDGDLKKAKRRALGFGVLCTVPTKGGDVAKSYVRKAQQW